jgi:hypothetical protein
MTDCYCDYDPPDFYHAEIRKARKPHKCVECSGVIAASEHYEHVRGKWDGGLDSFDTCQRCLDIRTWVKNSVPCFCMVHGNMNEEAKEAIDDAIWRAPAETVGLRFGFLRLIVKRDRLNQERRAA